MSETKKETNMSVSATWTPPTESTNTPQRRTVNIR